MVKYLVGRFADPILGIATGAFAYQLWEKDARNAEYRPPGRSLPELVQRWWKAEAPAAGLLGRVGPSEVKKEDAGRLV